MKQLRQKKMFETTQNLTEKKRPLKFSILINYFFYDVQQFQILDKALTF